MSLLDVKDWIVAFHTSRGDLKVLDRVNLKIEKGQTVGLVGESGSGKSILGLSLMGLLPSEAKIQSGEYHLDGQSLDYRQAKNFDLIRGHDMAMIFQDPISSLNPAFTVGYQLNETLKIHEEDQNPEKLKSRAMELLQWVGIPDPQARLTAYPHELSGGMAQRVMIAMALACRPKILIADEPTTALDVTIQVQILGLLKKIQKETGLSILLISHDMGVISQNCEKVSVMYCGKIVEEGPVDLVLQKPQHPYTKALLECLPSRYVFSENKMTELPTISGQVPSLAERPTGCVFRTRCPYAQEICKSEPPVKELPSGQKAACVLV